MAGVADFKYKRWKDKSGIVHSIEAIAFSGYSSGVSWVSLCGRHEPAPSNFIDAQTPATCMACIGNMKAKHSLSCRRHCDACLLHVECLKPHPCALCAEEA